MIDTPVVDAPVKAQGIRRKKIGQRTAGAMLVFGVLSVGLSGCGGPDRPVGVVGHVDGFGGMVVSDEPRAMMVGRDVLSAGGSPADAAVAMAFTLSVTLPSQASLGSGGVCMIYDHESKKTSVLDFIPAGPQQVGPNTSRPTSVPALPRGLFALQSKYGKLRWEALVSPAEDMARSGAPMSRAFARQLALVTGPLFEDPEARAIFARSGLRLNEGDMLVQPDLGAILARLRVKGVGDFYAGATAKDLVAAYNAAGGSLSAEELRAFAPQWKDPIEVKYGDDVALFPPPPAAAGLLEAQLWSVLAGSDAYKSAPPEQRPHLLAESFAHAYADRATWMNPEGTATMTSTELLDKQHLAQLTFSPNGQHQATAGDPPPDQISGTSFAAMDGEGSAVVCSLSLNNTFGVGRIAPGTGIMMAAAPGPRGRSPASLGPMLAINTNSNEFRFAGGAGGGTSGATALIQVALQGLVDGKKLSDAGETKRLHAQNQPDAVFVEPGYPSTAALEGQGHKVAESQIPGLVNALQCPSGSPRRSRCSYTSDPRGAGLGSYVGQ